MKRVHRAMVPVTVYEMGDARPSLPLRATELVITESKVGWGAYIGAEGRSTVYVGHFPTEAIALEAMRCKLLRIPGPHIMDAAYGM